MEIFIFLLAAHFLGDVTFNSQKLAYLKRSGEIFPQFYGNAGHSFIHAFLAAVLLLLGNYNWLIGSVSVFILHFLIDLVRVNFEIKWFGAGKVYVKRSEFIAWISGRTENPEKMNFNNLKPWFLINILDQICHLTSLLVISFIIK